MLTQIAKLVALFCCATFVAGCQYSPGMVDRTVAYNEAVADSSNQVLLLNIVRASQRHPTYYSRLSSSSSTGTIAPQLQMAIPLSDSTTLTSAPAGLTTQAVRAALTLTPQFQATETNVLTLNTLDDQKSIQGMMTPAGLNLFRYFQETGRQGEFLGLLLIHRIEISKDTIEDVGKRAQRACRKLKGKQKPWACWGIEDKVAGPPDKPTEAIGRCMPGSTILSPNDRYVFSNSPTSDTFECFQVALRALLVLGLDVVEKTKALSTVQRDLAARLLGDATFVQTLVANNLVAGKVSKHAFALCKHDGGGLGLRLARWASSGDTAESKPQNAAKTGKRKDTGSTSQKPKTAEQQCAETASPKKEEQERAQEEKDSGERSIPEAKTWVAIRSTEGVIYYLGQNVRAQADLGMAPIRILEGPPSTDPKDLERIGMLGLDETTKRTPVETPLFVVNRDDTDRGSAVAVDFEGRRYSIPLLCDGDCQGTFTIDRPKHKSLDVLTLVNQLWGLQKEATTQPPAPTVTVISQ